MPLESEVFGKIEEEAIQAAEILAEQNKTEKDYEDNEYKGIIDYRKELVAFYRIAYEKVTGYLKDTGHPKFKEIQVKMKEIMDESQSSLKEYVYDEEEKADVYWEQLIALIEFEERMQIQHSKEWLQGVLPGGVEVVSYENNGSHFYEVKSQGVQFDLVFGKDATIEISFEAGANRAIVFYETENLRKHDTYHNWISKDVSLMDIKDGSAFEYFYAFQEIFSSSAIVSLRWTYSLPKRSSDPVIQELMGLDKQISSLLDEIRMIDDSKDLIEQDKRKEYAKLVVRAQNLYAKLFKFYWKYKDTDYKDKLKLNPLGFRSDLECFPHIVLKAVSSVESLEQIQFFDFLKSYPDIWPKVEEKREELAQVGVKELEKLSEYKALSSDHKACFLRLIKYRGLKLTKPKPFLKAFRRIKKSCLTTFEDYLKGNIDKFIREDVIVEFVFNIRGFKEGQFECFVSYFSEKDNIWGHQFEDIRKCILAFPKEKDHKFLKIFIKASYYLPTIKKAMDCVKKVVPAKMSENELMNGLYGADQDAIEVMCGYAYLDKDYIDNFLSVLVDKLDLNDLTQSQFKQMNSFKPFQRMGFYYLVDRELTLFHKENVKIFLDSLSKIGSYAEVNYLYVNGPRLTIDMEKLKEVQMPFFAISDRASAKRYEEFRKEHEKYGAVSDHLESTFPEFVKGLADKYSGKRYAYKALELLFAKNVTEERIKQAILFLPDINHWLQVRTLEAMINGGNMLALFGGLAARKEIFQKGYGSDFGKSLRGVYLKIVEEKPPVSVVMKLIDTLAVISEMDSGIINLVSYPFDKAKDYNELFDCIEKIRNIKVLNALDGLLNDKELREKFEYKVYERVLNIYFYLNVSPADFDDIDKIVDEARKYALKALETSYDPDADPDYSKALGLLDPKKVLEKKDVSFMHISFVLNLLQGSSEECSEQKIREMALKFLNSSEDVMKEKGSKLLIGQGNAVQDFSSELVKKIAKNGVDERLSQYKISEKITDAQLNYLGGVDRKIPLSLYFSFLINLEQQGKSGDQKVFEGLVKRYLEIADKPVYEGKVLVLAHDVNDSTHSYVISSDSFQAESHKTFAKLQGLEIETLRHGQDQESVESMFSKLEMVEGDLTLVVGGHGSHNYISYGKEHFTMEMFFDRLARRVEKQTDGKKPWRTQVFFKSCHSGYNIQKLLEMWDKDPRTKSLPVRMLSSSSEDAGSAKMANDAWILAAEKFYKKGEPLTWEKFYKEIESRTFIMGNKRMNSNATLYIDGEKLG